ncbi:MAG: hypothetical protein NVS4B3_06370 [Gemmatimonadaceae bacterium]
MSGSEEAALAGPTPPDPRRTAYGTIVVVGGGCYGSYYVRQLRRAADAGRIAWTRLVVVDRAADCAIGGTGVVADREVVAQAPELVVSDWADFFRSYLADAAQRVEASTLDAIVPSPLMPHLLFDWLRGRATERWPGRRITTGALDSAPPTPWRRSGSDGTEYVSFATWMCPINCIEPARCPHTRGERSWSLPDTIRAFVETERSLGRNLAGPAIVHCTHRVYGVGMFDTAEVLRADALVQDAGTRRSARVLIGTMSHCHGAVGVLAVD